jgi:hypothetical protein
MIYITTGNSIYRYNIYAATGAAPSLKPFFALRCTTFKCLIRPVPVVLRRIAFTLQLSVIVEKKRREGGEVSFVKERKKKTGGETMGNPN